MWFMSVDKNNKPNGWDIVPWGTAIEVSQAVRDIHEANPDYIWNGTTLAAPPVPPPYVPTEQDIINSLTAALEAHYDSKAQAKQYDNRLTCALRAGYAGPFQAEGTAFAVWMDNCNVTAYGVMADVKTGLRGIPSAEELLVELPSAPW